MTQKKPYVHFFIGRHSVHFSHVTRWVKVNLDKIPLCHQDPFHFLLGQPAVVMSP